MKVNAKTAAKQRRLAAQLGEIGFALPGSLTIRAYKCGKQNCACKSDPPRLHGPYAFWTRKVNAKTVTRMLNEEQVAQYQPMFDNARKIRELFSELQELSLELVDPAKPSSKSEATPATKPTSAGTSRSRTRQTTTRQG